MDNRKKLEETDKLLYELGLVALGICIAAVLLYFFAGFDLLGLKYPCLFYKVTHYPCPGCGGTRAMRALLRGDIRRCLYDYPPMIFGVVVYVVFMVRCFLHKHFGVKKSKDGTVLKWFYAFFVLAGIQWIVKLAAQFFFGYHWF